MPDQTNSIQSGGGGDYSTIQAWEDDTDVSGGFWKGEIDDTSAYDEAVTISGGTGTPTASNYVWLEVSSGNRHAGAAGTGHGRLIYSGGNTAAITVSSDFVRIGFLEIKRTTGAGNSDEGIRLTDGNDSFLGESLIVWTDDTNVDQDGVYGIGDVSGVLVNCLIYGWTRAGVHPQEADVNPHTQTWELDYCSIDNCGSASEPQSGAVNCHTRDIDDVINLTCRNCAFMDTNSTFDDISVTAQTISQAQADANAVITLNNCITSDASQTANGDTVTNAVESATSSNVWTDATNGDYTVVNGGDADDAGANISGSPADSRADYTVDIAGTTRDTSTPDIGCFEEAAGGNTETLAATATGVAVLATEASFFRTLAATATGVAAVATVAKFFRTLAAVATGVAVLAAALTFPITLTATATGVAVLAIAVGYARELSATATGVATLARRLLMSRTLAAVATGVAALARKLSAFRTLAATAAGVAALVASTGGQFTETLAAVAVGVAVLSTTPTFRRALDAVASGVAVLAKKLSLFKTLAATATGVAAMTLSLSISRALAATATGVAVLARKLSVFKTLAATATGIAVLVASRFYQQTLAAIATVVATITVVFSEAPEEPTTPFSGDAGIRLLGRRRWRPRATKWRRRR